MPHLIKFAPAIKQAIGIRWSSQLASEASKSNMQHFKKNENIWENPIYHPVYSKDEVLQVKKTHVETKDLSDQLAYLSVKLARFSFDTLSGYRFGKLTTSKVLNRAIFLETVAGVPGFTAGILRHLRSLRRMERDYGWIHTLLEEAENERMHLLTFIKLKQPGLLFRFCVVATQGIFMNGFFLAYLLSPKFCHRFVGYLEEEAVKTYTDIIAAIDDGRLPEWKDQPAPEIAVSYWRLGENATLRDMFLAVRADEANHRDVNHTFATIKPQQKNPFLQE
ncbi:hypothetical protein HK103_001977 [Boothiomyces macroporosus]|uniref:Alternative oxidase n=1 Tax=Boothiomyces macroporosus TaxID=261099 RepID=A0AAD5Y4Z8_9FUNG|nr:hypothetical protein HK103_001977 [Boothiomyces macroporosus]